MYADDSQLYISFKNDNIERTEEEINKCLIEIKTWMSRNFLKMNAGKTQLMVFSPKLNNFNHNFSINYSNNVIEPIDLVTVLGVKIGKHLNLAPFINKKVQICSFHLKNLINIRDSLPYQTRIIMVTNVILSNLDYCNAILACCTEKSIKPLQIVLNRGIRFIFGINKFTHITPYLKKLHILPIAYRIKFKLCIFAFRIWNGISPSYLSEDFHPFVATTTMNLRVGPGRDKNMFDIHRSTGRDTLTKRIKEEWNGLPLNLRVIDSISKFKRGLKTFYFNQAFSNSIQ